MFLSSFACQADSHGSSFKILSKGSRQSVFENAKSGMQLRQVGRDPCVRPVTENDFLSRLKCY
jgi:hypothetical protein